MTPDTWRALYVNEAYEYLTVVMDILKDEHKRANSSKSGTELKDTK